MVRIVFFFFTLFFLSLFGFQLRDDTYIAVSPHIYTGIVNLFALGLSPLVDFTHSH